MANLRHRANRAINAWPGWVDALSSLVMVVIFLLMIFVVAQFYLATTLTGRDEQLQRLSGRINELTDMLAVERQANADLRASAGQVSDQLQASNTARENLADQLSSLKDDRDGLARQLQELNQTVKADKETIELRLREAASLEADLKALREARAKLESQVAALSVVAKSLKDQGDAAAKDRDQQAAEAATQKARADAAAVLAAQTGESLRLTEAQRQQLMIELGQLRDRSKALDSELADARDRTVLAQKDIDARDIRIKELMDAIGKSDKALSDEKALSADSARKVDQLNAEIGALKVELQRLNAALEASEQVDRDQKVQIQNLSDRVNAALASKVEELARYRSEFFGRVREALGNRSDVRVVGDRFVFQSELLFPTGSAALEPEGRDRLAQLAHTLAEVAAKMPPDINWVLRVDGHTDSRPIATPQFPSNWELSAARAISVAKFLIEQGIPPDRLAVAGFGEFQPIDPGTSEEALAHNRRIELKLDQK